MGLFSDLYEACARNTSLGNIQAERRNAENAKRYPSYALELKEREVKAQEQIAAQLSRLSGN